MFVVYDCTVPSHFVYHQLLPCLLLLLLVSVTSLSICHLRVSATSELQYTTCSCNHRHFFHFFFIQSASSLRETFARSRFICNHLFASTSSVSAGSSESSIVSGVGQAANSVGPEATASEADTLGTQDGETKQEESSKDDSVSSSIALNRRWEQLQARLAAPVIVPITPSYPSSPPSSFATSSPDAGATATVTAEAGESVVVGSVSDEMTGEITDQGDKSSATTVPKLPPLSLPSSQPTANAFTTTTTTTTTSSTSSISASSAMVTWTNNLLAAILDSTRPQTVPPSLHYQQSLATCSFPSSSGSGSIGGAYPAPLTARTGSCI